MQPLPHRTDMTQGRPAIAAEAVASVLDRLETTLQEENALLEARKSVPHEPFAVRKNQLLRELMVMQRQVNDSPVIAAMRDRLRSVRSLVDRNSELLKTQVEAMTQITNLLTGVALAEQADGTYSRQSQ